MASRHASLAARAAIQIHVEGILLAFARRAGRQEFGIVFRLGRGLTVIAAGTSLPDAFVSVRAAQKGEGTVSMANVLGSNIFDLLVAVPVGILIAGATPVDYAVAAPMMGFLTLATIILFAMMRTRLALTRAECIVLMMLYAVFVAWMVLETAGLTSVVT